MREEDGSLFSAPLVAIGIVGSSNEVNSDLEACKEAGVRRSGRPRKLSSESGHCVKQRGEKRPCSGAGR